ncbi:hypothetical protein [Fodinicola feengrottensis]|uniref:hypothetical protein n=1 Tax=Fodinicola feengrottensis TaxID=435914 RepID=UPI002442411A|nr:hypothetical protein [Fodinicola feengrottensis]
MIDDPATATRMGAAARRRWSRNMASSTRQWLGTSRSTSRFSQRGPASSGKPVGSYERHNGFRAALDYCRVARLTSAPTTKLKSIAGARAEAG